VAPVVQAASAVPDGREALAARAALAAQDGREAPVARVALAVQDDRAEALAPTGPLNVRPAAERANAAPLAT
jgi:hypothetical protein